MAETEAVVAGADTTNQKDATIVGKTVVMTTVMVMVAAKGAAGAAAAATMAAMVTATAAALLSRTTVIIFVWVLGIHNKVYWQDTTQVSWQYNKSVLANTKVEWYWPIPKVFWRTQNCIRILGPFVEYWSIPKNTKT